MDKFCGPVCAGEERGGGDTCTRERERERDRERRPTKKQKGSMIQSEITLVIATNMKKMK